MENYKKSFKEVYIILQHLTQESFDKIPKDVIDTLQTNMDNEYDWVYDNNKELIEQNISRDAVAILSYINMNYLLNKEQRELMEKIHKNNENLKKSKNKAEYNFTIKQWNSEFEEENKEESLIKKEDLKWYKKLFNRIRVLLNV